jgi:transcriptional regulator with XRE-family HTH domain
MRYPDGKKIRFDELVGEAIARERGFKGISQRRLAEAIGIAATSLAGFEDGRPCNTYTLAKIAHALGCPVHTLIPSAEVEIAA